MLLALVLAAIVPSAVAQEPAPPIQLNLCALTYDNQNSLTSQVTGLQAKFTNNSRKVATVVNIRANINGSEQVIRDEGVFSPGIEIDHRYRTGQGQFALPVILDSLFGKPQVQCSIDSVEFQDGTRWTPGAAMTAANSNPSAIQVHPATLILHGTGNANARLMLATGGGSLAVNSACGSVASVQILSTTAHDVALRVVPKQAGTCTITIRDINDNFASVPVSVTP